MRQSQNVSVEGDAQKDGDDRFHRGQNRYDGKFFHARDAFVEKKIRDDGRDECVEETDAHDGGISHGRKIMRVQEKENENGAEKIAVARKNCRIHAAFRQFPDDDANRVAKAAHESAQNAEDGKPGRVDVSSRRRERAADDIHDEAERFYGADAFGKEEIGNDRRRDGRDIKKNGRDGNARRFHGNAVANAIDAHADESERDAVEECFAIDAKRVFPVAENGERGEDRRPERHAQETREVDGGAVFGKCADEGTDGAPENAAHENHEPAEIRRIFPQKRNHGGASFLMGNGEWGNGEWKMGKSKKYFYKLYGKMKK